MRKYVYCYKVLVITRFPTLTFWLLEFSFLINFIYSLSNYYYRGNTVILKKKSAIIWIQLTNSWNQWQSANTEKESTAIPLQALWVPGGWVSQISRQSVHEDGKFVSPTQRPPLPPGNIPGTHFCSRLSQPQSRKDYVNEKSNDAMGNRKGL
jgi:hypothetical protein